MEFAFGPDVEDARSTVKRFVDEQMIPLEDRAPGDDGLSSEQMREVQGRVRDIGFWAPDVLPEYGGRGLGETAMLALEIELLRCLLPEYQPLWIFGVGWIKGVAMLYAGTEEQKKRYLLPVVAGEVAGYYGLTEPEAGSDVSALKTEARRDGGSWVINGRKTLVSNPPDATFAMVSAVTGSDDRGRQQISCLLVDTGTPGFRVSAPVATMGPRTVVELEFDDCRVPESALLGEEGQGFALGMRWINTERLYSGAYCLGRGSRLLEMALAYSESRATFGEPLINRQAIQWMLADCLVDLHTVRWITLLAGWKADQGQDVRTETAIVKLHAANAINRVADRVLQIHGGYGYTRNLPIERVYREARTYRIEDGTDEIHRINMVRGLRKGFRP